MFRDDLLTVKREEYDVVLGEAKYLEPVLVLENLPCHLSVSLNGVSKNGGVPYIMADFTLFLDYREDIDIRPNDILFVKTKQNQTYTLYAGEVKKYNFTIQIRAKKERIVEGYGDNL